MKKDNEKKESPDLNQIAVPITKQATLKSALKTPQREKNRAAVALGRLGGLKGGRARAEKLSAKRRHEIAKKAAVTRWK